MSRILLIAPTCDGEDIGEAWVAHQWADGLSARHDVTLVTYHKRGKTPASQQLPGLRIFEWTEPPLLGRSERLNSMLKPAYPWFYLKARRQIRRLLADGELFDVAFQPVPVAMRYPSPATHLGLRLIIGPVGGGLSSPAAFEGNKETAPWFVRLRNLDQWRLRRDPLLRATYKDAACVLGIAPYVRERLRAVPLRRFEVMSETALVSAPEAVDRRSRTGTVHLLYVGRLVRTKGAQEIIRALQHISTSDVHLDIVGDGPDRQACEELIASLGLGSKVSLRGALSRAQVDGFYRRADVFVFPSYREPGGNVVPEAMGFGLPLIVADRGGPGAATDDTCAIRLAITTPEKLVHDLAQWIDQLAKDPALRLRLGEAGRRRVLAHGLWQSRIDQLDEILASIKMQEG